MRALLPRLEDGVDIHDHYAAGWVESGGLRVNFVTSADGAAHAGGLSRGLQTPGDNQVFAALRDLADVVLVGAATAVAEGYRPARFAAPRRCERTDRGLAPTMPIAVTSRSLHLDPDASLFTDAAPDARTLVLTCAAADPPRRRALERVADVVNCGDQAVEPALVRAELERRGLTRILSEGGPTAFAQLADAGVVDEVCLSLSPVLLGPGAGRITAGNGWTESRELSLTGLLEEDGALFLRYLAPRVPSPGTMSSSA